MQSDGNLPTFRTYLLKLEIVERQQICKELGDIALQNTVISVAMGGGKLLQDKKRPGKTTYVSTYTIQLTTVLITEMIKDDKNILTLCCWRRQQVFLNSRYTYKLRGFSPRANHTDRAAAAGRRS